MILLVDNYDSFTWNLYQYIGAINPDIQVIRNDAYGIQEVGLMEPDGIVLSPGPKTPDEAGICIEIIRCFSASIPILGICLGHQCIGKAYGAEVSYAKEQMHGKKSRIIHFGDSLFKGIPDCFSAARYHSLSIVEDSLPEELRVTAYSSDDGEIMAIRHTNDSVFGFQFHPESVYTQYGKKIITNFLIHCERSSVKC